jgi:hypothetical protein
MASIFTKETPTQTSQQTAGKENIFKALPSAMVTTEPAADKTGDSSWLNKGSKYSTLKGV